MIVTYTFQNQTECFVSAEDLASINDLLGQLSPQAEPLNSIQLGKIIRQNYFLLARDDNKRIIGMATLVPIIVPAHSSGRIEDVVVDDSQRGKGIGKDITKQLIAQARLLKMERVDLTSHPDRQAANALYQSMGFELAGTGKTNFYSLDL